jgi:hypothetical protein
MVTVPLGATAYKRTYSQAPEIKMVNRFFETSPPNQVEGGTLLSRPGTKLFGSFGSGPIRKLFTQPGSFGTLGDLFVVSGDKLYRYNDIDGTTPISGTVADTADPSITTVSGPGFEYLFIADGTLLQFYEGLSFARGTLTSTGAISSGDTVLIDTVYYEWTNGGVDVGSPAGTMADPFLVNLDVGVEEALNNLLLALNANGAPGTDYSTAINIPHLSIEGVRSDDTKLDVKARTRGTGGNSLVTTVPVGANLAWDAATLEGGGTHQLLGVPTPDDVGVVSLATSKSFVIAVVANSQRFYWIEPGFTTIDPINFASAESIPDEIISVLAVGDQLWFFGQGSTEPWYVTTNPLDRLLPSQGRAFSRGVVEGTPVVVKDSVVLVGNDGIVYSVSGGPQRISTNGIEERIRIARKEERENG